MMSTQQDSQTHQDRIAQHDFIQESLISKFQIIKKLGSGAYGHVWKVRCKTTNKIYALKKIFLAFDNETDAQRAYRQISILKQIKHNNVVKLLDIMHSTNKKDIYLLFESLQSDLFKAIKNRVLDQTHKKFIVYQLACALKYIHSSGVVHRDLKPSNILINSNCLVKICDFGLSRTFKSQFFTKAIMTQFVATRWYRSPEIIFGGNHYGIKSDMWSLGCLIYQLYSRRTLLPGEDVVDQITKLLQFKGMPTQRQIASMNTQKAKQIIRLIEVQKKPLQQYYDDLQCEQVKVVLNNLFHYDPNKRWSAQQLLQCQFLSQFKDTLVQDASIHTVILPLNDNRKYAVQRYQQSVIKAHSQVQLKTMQKRQILRSKQKQKESMSLRNSTQCNTLLRNSLSSLIKQSLHSASQRNNHLHKKYQSAHISPLPIKIKNSSKQLIRLSSKLRINSRQKQKDNGSLTRNTVCTFNLKSRDNSTGKDKDKSVFVKNKFNNKKSARSIYMVKKQANLSGVKKDRQKQNQENKMKVLKRIKVKYGQA